MSFPERVENIAGLSDPVTTATWITRERRDLIARLDRTGALLLRGFPIEHAEDFDRVVEAFDLGRFSYRESLSNAVRIDLTDRVFTANEAPPEATIRLHHELAQTPAHPRHLFFFCERAAAGGGETALCRSDDLFDLVLGRHPAFVDDLERHGLVYHHVMPGEDDPDSPLGRSWRSTLDVTTAAEAEERLQKLGYAWEWLEGDAVAVTTPPLPALARLPDGRRAFFNQLVATRSWRDARNDPDRALRLGDGRPVPLALRDEIADLTESLALDLDWRRGDVVVLDNHRVQHGRRTFDGTRRVLVAFGGRA